MHRQASKLTVVVMLLLLAVRENEGHSAAIHLSQSVVAAGGSALVSCQTEMADQEVSPVTVILKHLHQTEGQRLAGHFPPALSREHLRDMQATELSTNHFLNEEVARTGRHRCSYHLAAPGDYTRIEYRLAIDNVSTEDFGYYSCRMSLGNQTVESDAKLLQVVSPVAEVRWTEYDASTDSWQQLQENETILVAEDQFMAVRCESEGGFPKPTYAVVARRVGQADGSDKPLDITSHFREKSTCPLGKGPRGLQKLHISSVLSPLDRIPKKEEKPMQDDGGYRRNAGDNDDTNANNNNDDDDEDGSDADEDEDDDDADDDDDDDGGHDVSEVSEDGLKAAYEYHERNIVCSATVALDGNEKTRKMSASIFVELSEFRPKFHCPDKMAAEPNAQNFSIACVIRARPGIKTLKIFVNGSVPVEQRNGEFTAEMEAINGTNDEEVQSRLIIYRVSWKHFASYEFVAVNDVGNSTHFVQLIRDNKSQKTLYQKSMAGVSGSPRTADATFAAMLTVNFAALAVIGRVF